MSAEEVGREQALEAALSVVERDLQGCQLALGLAEEKIRGLSAALDAERHHLSSALGVIDRERQAVDLERQREQRADQQLQTLVAAYNQLQERLANQVQPPVPSCGHASQYGVGGDLQPPRVCTQPTGHREAIGTPHGDDSGSYWDDDGAETAPF